VLGYRHSCPTRRSSDLRHDVETARALLYDVEQIRVEEAELRQHFLLTKAWLELETGDLDSAEQSSEVASEVFGERSRGGDHTPQDRKSTRLNSRHLVIS